jgi:hydrogenase-4 component B
MTKVFCGWPLAFNPAPLLLTPRVQAALARPERHPGAYELRGVLSDVPAVFIVGVSAVPVLIYLAARPRGRQPTVPVWDGGTARFSPRIQYTAMTYSSPVRVIFDRLYSPDVHVDRASEDPAGASGPVHDRRQLKPIFEDYLDRPVTRFVQHLARLLAHVQSGDINWYLPYTLVAVVVAYFVAAR